MSVGLEQRLVKLRERAIKMIHKDFPLGVNVQITQVGRRGFHYRVEKEVVARFRAWHPMTVKANGNYF